VKYTAKKSGNLEWNHSQRLLHKWLNVHDLTFLPIPLKNSYFRKKIPLNFFLLTVYVKPTERGSLSTWRKDALSNVHTFCKALQTQEIDLKLIKTRPRNIFLDSVDESFHDDAWWTIQCMDASVFWQGHIWIRDRIRQFGKKYLYNFCKFVLQNSPIILWLHPWNLENF
jgi:hypothetical protein